MKKFLNSILIVSLFFVFNAFAENATTVATAPQKNKKDLSLSVDTQWINGVRTFKSQAIDSSSDLIRVHVGGEYIFSDISTVHLRLPIVFDRYTAKYTVPGGTVSYSSKKVYVDRLRTGIDGKLFLDTALGQVSWFAHGYLPTMMGFKNRDYEFNNYMALFLGIKTIQPILDQKALWLSSVGYGIKFEKTFQGETINPGDEISVMMGLGYLITPKISPVVQVQLSHIFPEERKVGSLEIDSKKSLSAIHVVPNLSYSITENLALRANAKVLLFRTKVRGMDTGYLWRNFEDEGDLSAQLGIRLGIY